ncbi:MAG TPA: T9SS type A sorting domain-containing protein [Saprospiraceae bacterium]|nr:T9SS type A sorting domain-containing protein [Saprospiraceae bacterium]
MAYAQEDCSGSFTEYYLNSNNIRASFFPKGNKFTDGSNPGFLVPYPSPQKLSTIFASSPWIGGFDDAGNLKLAVETYPVRGKNDFSVGPLTNIGIINDTICGKFDQAWSVYYEDIQAHRKDYSEDFIIDDTIASIFGWPGRGNKFFKNYYGFELPFDNQGLAPFSDQNGNDIYDPENGDFPVARLESHSREYIPDQILWMVFNDLDTNEVTGHKPLRFEIQLTAFAFHCQDNEILNNTIFSSYKIIDRAISVIDSVFFGMWTDYDLGCYLDDGIGSDSMRSTEFVYNADDKDGDVGMDCSNGADTYANDVPVQSMTYLNYPMHSMITAAQETDLPLEFFRQLNGQWPDGTPITPEGDGYNPGSGLSPTKFLFNGDPRDPQDWATINVLPEGANQRIVSSVYLGRMDPGAIREVSTAHMFHYDPALGHLDQITKMYSNIDSLFTLFTLSPALPCTPFPICDDDDCVWPGDFDKNGIADHRDYLMWGVMNDLTGAERNGLVSWRGHYGEDWNEEVNGINSKHGDGDGNGEVNILDIDINMENFLQKNKDYVAEANYPAGPEIVLTANPFIDDRGRVRSFTIITGRELQNVLGLTFEIEYDTSRFQIRNLITSWPVDTSRLIYRSPYDPYQYFNASFVQTNNTGITIENDFLLLRSLSTLLDLKPGSQIPDSTIIRLRNLIAIDPEGNDLHIGSNQLTVYREGFTATSDLAEDNISIYPNPSHDVLYIDTPEALSGEIINLQGQVIKQVQLRSDSPVDVSALNPGLYLLRISGSSHTFKIVIY